MAAASTASRASSSVVRCSGLRLSRRSCTARRSSCLAPVMAASSAALVALLWLVDAWMARGTAASGAALAAARDTGVLFLSTAFVIVPGLGFVILIERMGVNQALSQWVRSLGLGPADQVVFIVLGLAPLLEAMTGFGVSLIATVPLLLSLFERRPALRMALAGMAMAVRVTAPTAADAIRPRQCQTIRKASASAIRTTRPGSTVGT